MASQENIKNMSNLREEALKLIAAYNRIADEENFETRIGIIDSSVEIDYVKEKLRDKLNLGENEELPEDSVFNINAMVDDYEITPYFSVDMPEAKGAWVPSGLNC